MQKQRGSTNNVLLICIFTSNSKRLNERNAVMNETEIPHPSTLQSFTTKSQFYDHQLFTNRQQLMVFIRGIASCEDEQVILNNDMSDHLLIIPVRLQCVETLVVHVSKQYQLDFLISTEKMQVKSVYFLSIISTFFLNISCEITSTQTYI